MSTPRSSGSKYLLVVVLIVLAGTAFVFWQQSRLENAAVFSGPDSVGINADASVFQKLCKGKEAAGEGRHQEALALFEEIARNASSESYKWDAEVQAALAMANLKQMPEALARLDRIIAQCPLKEDVPNAEITKAEVLHMSGQPEAAIALLEAVVAANTDIFPRMCEEALVEQATIYHRMGQPGLVHATFARLITDYPGSEDTRRIWAEKQTEILTEAHAKSQEPRVAKLVAGKQVTQIAQLGPGTTTLAAASGPYLITEPLKVGGGQVLRIEAGGQVRFGVRGKLSVEGRLEIVGTKDQPVLLLPLSDDPANDWWPGIEVTQRGSAQDPSRLGHCRVLGAEIGLAVRGGTVELDQCKVDRCGRVSVLAGKGSQLTMTSCEIVDGHRIGVEAQTASRLRIDDCRIATMTTYGLSLQELAEGSWIRRSRIESCGWTALLIRGRCVPVIEDCEVRGAEDNGIDALDGASPRILNTRVEQNRGIGIRIRDRSQAVIRGNKVADNGKTGIVAETRCTGEIVGNRVEENREDGLRLRLGCTTRVDHNLFVKNKGLGLLVQNCQPENVQGNQFSENGDAALRNEGPNTIQADSNWWGSTNEAEIAKMIQGQEQNPGWGRVEFRPWLSAPPAGTNPAS